jgi:hypothetical protein
MQRIITNRILGFALGLSAIVAGACSNDASTVGPISQPSNQSGPGATDTSHAPTSNGSVASVRVTPATLTIPEGTVALLSAVGLDANGAVVTGKAAWRAADPNIVFAGDSGLVYGAAGGTTKVYATINGHTDSATVTVTPAPPAPPLPPVVASFDLNALVVGPTPGSDSTASQPIAGAVVKLASIGTITGDSLSQSIDAGSATTDANGLVSFKALPGGSYSVIITPPAGSPFDVIQTGFAPPRTSTVELKFKLFPKKP